MPGSVTQLFALNAARLVEEAATAPLLEERRRAITLVYGLIEPAPRQVFTESVAYNLASAYLAEPDPSISQKIRKTLGIGLTQKPEMAKPILSVLKEPFDKPSAPYEARPRAVELMTYIARDYREVMDESFVVFLASAKRKEPSLTLRHKIESIQQIIKQSRPDLFPERSSGHVPHWSAMLGMPKPPNPPF